MNGSGGTSLIRRRSVIGGAAALGTAFAARQAGAANDRLVYANYGGSWEVAMRRAWADPFTKETGIQVVSASDNTMGKLQAMVEAKRTEWDLVEGTPEIARLGAERGLLEPLDFSVIDRSAMLRRPEFMNDYMVPEVLFSRVLIARKSLGTLPRGWSALFDVKRFPGKRTLWNRAESGILEIALMADGVPEDKLYPLDVPRALAKLATIRDHILWFDTVTQSEQFMRDGQAVMGVLADGRALNVVASGAPVEIVPDTSILTYAVFVVPKGAPNKAAAMRFLGYVYTVRAQAAIALAYNYGPVIPQALEQIPPERLKIISGGAKSGAGSAFLDSNWWGSNLGPVTEQFQQWMLG